MKNILDFLITLQENNTREWFNENRKQYETAKAEMEEVINNTIPLIREFDPTIGSISAKECMFRIFRDVRFSKDKSPYKTNFGGFMSKGGRKGVYSGYYVHIQPGASFIGGGCYMPQSDSLKKLRQEILYNIDEFKGIINNKNFTNTFNQLEGDKLKRPPKDFPADFPDIELLKFKSYVVFKSVSDKEVLSKTFMDDMINIFKAMHPLNQFLNRALD